MSKRFGRNQKRKLKAELEKLQVIATERDYLHQRLRSVETRLNTWAQTMNHHLGSLHPLNEVVKQQYLQRVPFVEERYRFQAIPDFNAVMKDVLSHHSLSTEATCKYIETVLHQVSFRRDIAGCRVIAELIAPDKQCYYAIDDQMLYEGRTDPRFIKWLSDEIAQGLSCHIATK